MSPQGREMATLPPSTDTWALGKGSRTHPMWRQCLVRGSKNPEGPKLMALWSTLHLSPFWHACLCLHLSRGDYTLSRLCGNDLFLFHTDWERGGAKDSLPWLCVRVTFCVCALLWGEEARAFKMVKNS